MDQIQYFFLYAGGVSTYPLVVLGIMTAVLFRARIFA